MAEAGLKMLEALKHLKKREKVLIKTRFKKRYFFLGFVSSIMEVAFCGPILHFVYYLSKKNLKAALLYSIKPLLFWLAMINTTYIYLSYLSWDIDEPS